MIDLIHIIMTSCCLFQHLQLKCCGADGKDDFQETSAWDKTYNTSTATILVEAPLICCVTIADDCSSVATSLTNSYNQVGSSVFIHHHSADYRFSSPSGSLG